VLWILFPLNQCGGMKFLLNVNSSCTHFATYYLSFSTQLRRFMDGYCIGLNGKQAAYANKKYQGHRVLPATIFDELATAKIV